LGSLLFKLIVFSKKTLNNSDKPSDLQPGL